MCRRRGIRGADALVRQWRVCLTALALVCISGVDAHAQTQQNWGQALGNLLGATITDAIHASIVKSWQSLDPAVTNCLETRYGVNPAQFAESSVSANDRSVKPFVDACKQLFMPPPLDIPGYRENPPGTYVRTSAGLAAVRSKYFFRDTVPEVGSDAPAALLAGVNQKAQSACPGEYSVSEYHLHSSTDPNAATLGIQGPWIDAVVDCSADRAGTDSPAGMIIAELTKPMAGGAYFDLHAVVLDAAYDDAFAVIERLLIRDGDPVVRADPDKGVIATGHPTDWNVPYYEQFFIVLDPTTDTTTTMTFKLLASSRDAGHPNEFAFMIEDEDTVNRRADEFVAAVVQALHS